MTDIKAQVVKLSVGNLGVLFGDSRTVISKVTYRTNLPKMLAYNTVKDLIRKLCQHNNLDFVENANIIFCDQSVWYFTLLTKGSREMIDYPFEIKNH